MNISKRLCALLLMLVMMISMITMPAFATETTNTTITVDTSKITLGEQDDNSTETLSTKIVAADTVFTVDTSFYVPVIVSNLESFNGYNLQLTYNPDVLKFEGVQTSFKGKIVFNNKTYDISFGETLLNSNAPVVNTSTGVVMGTPNADGTSLTIDYSTSYGYLFFAKFTVVGKTTNAGGKETIGIQAKEGSAAIGVDGVANGTPQFVAGEINVEKEIIPLSLVNNKTESWNVESYSNLQNIMASGKGLTAPGDSNYYFMGWFTGLQTDEALTMDANGYYVLSAERADANYVLSGATELRPRYDAAPESGEYHALWLYDDMVQPYSAVLQTTDSGITLLSTTTNDESIMLGLTTTLLKNALENTPNGCVKLLMDMNVNNITVSQIRLDMNGRKISAGTLQVGHGVTSFVDSSRGKGTMDGLLKFMSSNVETTSMVDYIRDVVFMDTLDFDGKTSYSNVKGFTVTVIERCVFNNPDGLAMNLYKTTVKEIADCEINAREFIYADLTDVGSVSASNTSIHDCVMTQSDVGAKPPFAYPNQHNAQLVFGSNNRITALHGYTVTAADGTTSVSHNLIAVHEHNPGTSTGTKFFIVDEAVRAEVNADTTHAKSFYRVAPGGTVVNTAGLTLSPAGYAPETDAAGYLSFADVYTVTYMDSNTTVIDTQFARPGEGYMPPQYADKQHGTNALDFYKVVGWSTAYVNYTVQTPENPAPETIVDTENETVAGNITLYPVYKKYTAEPNFKTYFTYNGVNYEVGSWSLADVDDYAKAATGLTSSAWKALAVDYRIELLRDFEDTGTNVLTIGTAHNVTLDLMGHTFTTAHNSEGKNDGLLNVQSAGSGSITITSTGGRGKIITEGYVVLLKTAKGVENSLTVENVDIERTGTGNRAVFDLNPSSYICTTNVLLKNVKVDAPTADRVLVVATSKDNYATVHVTIENSEFNAGEKLLYAAKDATSTTVKTLTADSFLKLDAATKIKTATGNAPTSPLTITCTDATLTELHDQDGDGWYSFAPLHTCNYTELKSDETGHWYECECGEKQSEEVTAHADETTKDHKCDTCEYVMSECSFTVKGDVVIEANCVTKAVYKAVCSVCGAVSKTETITGEMDSTKHSDTTNHDQQDATCTSIGYTAGTYCNDCEKWISGHEEIKELDHDYAEAWLSDAAGHWHKCNNCDATTEVEEHTEGEAVEENRIEATESVAGSYDSVVYCTVCDAELSRETIEIPQLEAPETVTYGDVNGDGSVNAKDATIILRYAAQLEDEINENAADVNGDGSINAKDATIILRYAAKLISKFPVEE